MIKFSDKLFLQIKLFAELPFSCLSWNKTQKNFEGFEIFVKVGMTVIS